MATFHYQLLRRDIFHLEINDTFYVLKTISVIVTSEKRPSAAKMNKKFSTGRLFFPSIYRRKSLTTSSLLFFEKKIQQIPEIQQQNKTSPAMATTMIPSRAKCSHHKRSIRAPPSHQDAEQIGHQFPAD